MSNVGIGELAVVRGDAGMRTMSLGSCVAVVLVDRVRQVVGMAHIVLPDGDPASRNGKPAGYFADTGISSLIDAMGRQGSGPRMGPLHVALIGGGTAGRSTGGVFNIGSRNVAAVRSALARYHIVPSVVDVGGTWSRTVTTNPREIIVTCPDRPNVYL